MAEVIKEYRDWGKKSDVVENMKALSGYEAAEGELGKSIVILLRMLGNHAGYQHQMNDPLLKAHMLAIQFAKNNDMLDEYIQHDIDTMEPINSRVKNMIDKSGKKELALAALFDRTACHYALALDTTGEPGMRTWKSPFKTVLAACKKIGQFDLTEEEIHEKWTKPRLKGYGKALGVELEISDLDEDGTVTVRLVD